MGTGTPRASAPALGSRFRGNDERGGRGNDERGREGWGRGRPAHPPLPWVPAFAGTTEGARERREGGAGMMVGVGLTCGRAGVHNPWQVS